MARWKAVIPALASVLSQAPNCSIAAQQTPGNFNAGFYQPPDNPGNEQNKKDQAAPEEPTPHADPCAATLTENDGVIRLSLADAARAGKTLAVGVDDFGDDLHLNYDASFDASGQLQLSAPIFHENAVVQWEGAGGQPCQQTVRFSGYSHAFRTALIWTGPVVLALHVVEPTGAIGSASHYVSPSRPNLGLGPGSYGFLREFGEGGSKLHVQLYSVPSGKNPRDNSPVSFHVENVSRGNPTTAPFCGDNPLARTPYQAIFQREGQPPKLARGSFAPLACGFSWKENERSFSRLSDMRM